MSLSRIGKLPVIIPAGVTITVDSGDVTVEGPKGKLVQFITPAVDVKVEDGQVTVHPKDESRQARAQHGLMRALINNMVVGVTQGYERRLEVKGVGFRVSSSNNELTMSLGFSHEVKYKAPEGVNVSNEKMVIVVSGIDKQKVGQTAAEIRALKKPEPYKGKGIMHLGEQILRKAGKAGKK
ncbi:50S ribosomal protein L6 [Candidatus Southlakia epibionticum]|uniref:Large ribosomal subunit protein uL6 n=1 Tax=Candidatus Southlakia epibionticum TaxID=3043284 RepID=A0ABY8WUP2_9BACT|nr:50S ribosomal protein L6 [Candidatus Saccharimonadaceae bacterium ML1]